MSKLKFREIQSRAHVYLGIMIFRLIAIGLIAVFSPKAFVSPAYAVVSMIAPLPVWGGVMIGIGLWILYAIYKDNSKWARIGVVLCAFITGIWAFSMVGAVVADRVYVTLIGPIIWGALTAKDLVMASMAYSAPIDKVLANRPDLIFALGLLAKKRTVDTRDMLLAEMEKTDIYNEDQIAALRRDVDELECDLATLAEIEEGIEKPGTEEE